MRSVEKGSVDNNDPVTRPIQTFAQPATDNRQGKAGYERPGTGQTILKDEVQEKKSKKEILKDEVQEKKQDEVQEKKQNPKKEILKDEVQEKKQNSKKEILKDEV
jgi:hypothetical protein